MNALQGTIADRTRASLAAGCDMILHCNGKLDEMAEVAANAPVLAGKALARADAALKARKKLPQPFDRNKALAELDELVARAGALMA
jgi:beta-N-acetylhexosaminidase